MFERELNQHISIEENGGVIRDFKKKRAVFNERSLLQWSEHCSECSMPHCFETCSFYDPRPDLKCRRFTNGISSINNKPLCQIFEVEFGMWGKLESIGAHRLYSKPTIYIIEKIDFWIGRFINIAPNLYQGRLWLSRKLYGLKNKLAKSKRGVSISDANSLILEIINPMAEAVTIRLIITNVDVQQGYFQKTFTLSPGHQSLVVDLEEITHTVDLELEYLCQIEPIDNKQQTRLIFGMMDFIRNNDSPCEQDIASSENKKIKCVVWDLDNTLWKGTLIEDGIDAIVPNQQAIELIKLLDQRGILNSIASKNYYEDAWKVIEKIGLAEYFLVPQITWDPKSVSIENIQKSLNIGMDTIAFIDDQPFERSEVESRHPSLTLFDETDITSLAASPLFDVPITQESSRRRQMYKEQTNRQEAFTTKGANYEEFLRDCKISVSIEPLDEPTLIRAHELAQRTNQMNFSGHRYSVEELRAITHNQNKRAHIIRCEDRFGDYGIIGMVIIDNSKQLIEDMMFSCRIQAKQVDVGVVTYYLQAIGPDLSIYYKPSTRNKKAAEIFPSLGFKATEQDGDLIYKVSPDITIPAMDIIEIAMRDTSDDK